MSLRIVPQSSHPTSISNTKSQSKTPSTGAPSAPGLPDLLRAPSHHHHHASSASSATQTSTHPLESRLTQWHSTQETLKSNLLRRNFGIAEPLRRGMELQMVRKADEFRPSVLGAPAKIHSDILTGRDAEITWEDVYAGQDGLRRVQEGDGGEAVQGGGSGWTSEIEGFVGMGKW